MKLDIDSDICPCCGGAIHEIGGARQRRARVAYTVTRKGRGSSLPPMPFAVLLIGAAGIGFTSSDISLDRITSALPGSGCIIKGNVSVEGERIYHVPGQKYYDETVISLHYGERWFCSEADARRAGWRRARM